MTSRLERVIVLAAVVGSFLASSCCSGSSYTPSSDNGGAIFMEACFSCHGGGSTGPALSGRHLTPELVESRLDHGGGGMPSFPNIKGAARKNLVAYVVGLGENSH